MIFHHHFNLLKFINYRVDGYDCDYDHGHGHGHDCDFYFYVTSFDLNCHPRQFDFILLF